jgi:hypothetical protein
MTDEAKGRAIFISYRRDDSEGEAGRLFDDLVRAYGDDSVFMDVSAIAPGLDFRQAIDDNVATCGVLLAVIGPTWATVADVEGHRRLDNANDFVRLEIASALHRKIPVIPVLVHDARMPALDALPDDLKELRYRNSVELTHARWNSDVALLTAALKTYVSEKTAPSTETVHATVPVQLPAPDGDHSPGRSSKSKVPLMVGIGVAAVAAVAIGFAVLHKPTADSGPTPVVSADGAKALLGKWKSAADVPGGDDLERITVAEFDGQLMVQAWGKCKPRDCDWGSRKATVTGANAVTERWDLRNTPQENADQRQAVISLAPSAGGLQVTVKNTYQMPNGKTRELLNPLQFVKE